MRFLSGHLMNKQWKVCCIINFSHWFLYLLHLLKALFCIYFSLYVFQGLCRDFVGIESFICKYSIE